MVQIPRFITNTPDDNHCLQAAVAMVSEAFFDEPMDIEHADEVTHYYAGRLTWPFRAWLYFADRGLQVSVTERFDYAEFCVDPRSELLKQSGDADQVTKVLADTDIEAEITVVRQCLDHPLIAFDNRIPVIADIVQTVEAGGLTICNVNAIALRGKEGWHGHFVVVDEIRNNEMRLQDPGLPPLRDRYVVPEEFIRAWASPKAEMANVQAILRPDASMTGR